MGSLPKLGDSESRETRWNAYNQWNVRHPEMSRAWVEQAALWLVNDSPLVPARATVLDYGCGYFDLGCLLQPHFSRVDGYDPNDQDLAVAKRAGLPKSGKLFAERGEIPGGAYDLIVLNSVAQYFAGEAELREFFAFGRRALREGEGAILLTDLLPREYNAFAAAFSSLRFAGRRGLLWPWCVHLWKAATKPPALALYRLDFPSLREIAREEGFAARLLEGNLTPARQRYSVWLPRA